MGVLKPIKVTLKVAATAVLGVTGAVSAVLETVSDNGTFTGPNILTDIKEASFGEVKALWNENDTMNKIVDGVDSFATSAADIMKRQAAQAAHSSAMKAKKSGDMKRYEEFMDKYQELR